MEENNLAMDQTAAADVGVLTSSTACHAKKSRRRRRHRYAAPLGFFVLLFAIIGVISTVIGGVKWITRAGDDSALRQELYVFLDPVMEVYPTAFDDAGTAEDQSALILAAVYRVSEAERVRQLQEKDDTCTYELETVQWRMIVPQETVDASFAVLFGEKRISKHQSVGDAEYDAEKKAYYVPLSLGTSGYTPVLGKISRKKSVYTVQVGYVSGADIQYDQRGNALTPHFSEAKYSQRYTVQKDKDGWTLMAVADVS